MALAGRAWAGPGVVEASKFLPMKSIGNLFYPDVGPSFRKYSEQTSAI